MCGNIVKMAMFDDILSCGIGREDMLRLDELNREMAAQRALVGYTALQPRFPPTFKVCLPAHRSE